MKQIIKKYLLIASLCIAFIVPAQVNAQYFSNNAVSIPTIGWMGFNTTTSFMEAIKDNPWPSSDQIQVGFGYMHALTMGYKLWYIVQTSVGFGYAENLSNNPHHVVVSLNVSSGLRFNFLTRRHRPFIQGQLEWLQIFNTPDTSGAPFWLGFTAGPGYEWIFAEDMGIQIEAGAHVFSDFLSKPRFSWNARLSYTLYL